MLAESALAASFDCGTAGDRYQIVLPVSADDAAGTQGESRASSVRAPQSAGPAALDGVVEVDHGALYVSMETSRRLACDASSVQMRHDADGNVLDVGRKTRAIPPSIRRALAARDTSCRFPGCTSRRCDAHHVHHWADGGATSLGNLVLLCRRHHRAVHEGGFGVIRGLDGSLTFLRPDGAPLPAVPATPRALPDLHDVTPLATGKLPRWDGSRFDLPWAMDVIRFNTAALVHGTQNSPSAEGSGAERR